MPSSISRPECYSHSKVASLPVLTNRFGGKPRICYMREVLNSPVYAIQDSAFKKTGVISQHVKTNSRNGRW
ncbi:hypothetical protein EJB05_41502 [Eragrostis curvula]|uniref:Uncharacterized protein n=1 Tax=Eragrostis curvula TaxID=38414 RepID=A0A5J9T9P3_9POAL|nr:hypothetical protein EJB05_41502 [Eragrostis curvula]